MIHRIQLLPGQTLKRTAGPRFLIPDDMLEKLSGSAKEPVEILFPKDDSEAWFLAQQIFALLKRAGGSVDEPKPAIASDDPSRASLPPIVAAGGQPTGVTLVFSSIDEWRKAGTPTNGLRQAFREAMKGIKGAENPALPKGLIRIVVGPKE